MLSGVTVATVGRSFSAVNLSSGIFALIASLRLNPFIIRDSIACLSKLVFVRVAKKLSNTNLSVASSLTPSDLAFRL